MMAMNTSRHVSLSIMFTTERLILRGFKPSDEDQLLALWNDPKVQPTVVNDYIVPRGQKFIETVRKELETLTLSLVIETKDTSEFAGFLSVGIRNPKNRDAEFGIMFFPQFWGKGYGTEATQWAIDYSFQWFNIHRFSLIVFGGNETAISLYKRL